MCLDLGDSACLSLEPSLASQVEEWQPQHFAVLGWHHSWLRFWSTTPVTGIRALPESKTLSTDVAPGGRVCCAAAASRYDTHGWGGRVVEGAGLENR